MFRQDVKWNPSHRIYFLLLTEKFDYINHRMITDERPQFPTQLAATDCHVTNFLTNNIGMKNVWNFWEDFLCFFLLREACSSCARASQVALVVKNLPEDVGDTRDAGLIPGMGRSPRRARQPTPILLPGESHGQRSLAGCSRGATQNQTQMKWLSTYAYPTCQKHLSWFPIFTTFLSFRNIEIMSPK